MLYSAQTNGFYTTEVHGSAVPPDVVEITDAEHSALLEGQSAGGRIAPGEGGFPVLIPAPVIDPLTQERAGMVVSRFQARAALHNAGLLSAIETAVAAADPFAQIAWADAQEFRRNSATIAALAAAAGLSDEQLDDLFRMAALIEA